MKFVILTGMSGAGKTTAMKAILGLIKADRGQIDVCGEPVTFGETRTNRYIGYLPDVPEFYSFMTGREYLRLCGECLNMTNQEIGVRCDELLSTVGLAAEKHRIGGYSRGMKQRPLRRAESTADFAASPVLWNIILPQVEKGRNMHPMQ